SLFIYAGGDFVCFYDSYDSQTSWYANCNTPNSLTNANNLLGQWHWYEVYCDTSDDAHHVIAKVWVDGVLLHYHDAAFLDAAGGPSTTPNPNFQPGSGGGTGAMGFVQLSGTINAMVSQSSYWLQQVGFSTQQMGIPRQSYP